MPPSTNLQQFFQRSRDFYSRHPRPISSSTTLEGLIQSKRIREEDADKYVKSTRIIVSPAAEDIALRYLAYTKVNGNKTQKGVYDRLDWNLDKFLVRLIEKRPLCFFGNTDTTVLRDGKYLGSATEKWDRVGTDNESRDITMEEYLSYDEMMVSSLIGMSGYTPYLNDGGRHNRGVLSTGQQKEGVQVGIVGARFEREGKMDSVYYDVDYTKSKHQQPQQQRKGFFSSVFPGETFEERYKARMRVTVDTLLIESELRGTEAQKKVHVYVVGLGLGVWRVHPDQSRWFIEVFTQALPDLRIKHIEVLEFAYIDADSTTRQNLYAAANFSKTQCLFSKRNPSEKLADPELLLITSYAWDANSYPGNEFYLGMLSASGDPAAACSTAISETHNPEVNVRMLESIRYLK